MQCIICDVNNYNSSEYNVLLLFVVICDVNYYNSSECIILFVMLTL